MVWLISIPERDDMISFLLLFEEVLIVHQYSKSIKRMNWVSTVK